MFRLAIFNIARDLKAFLVSIPMKFNKITYVCDGKNNIAVANYLIVMSELLKRKGVNPEIIYDPNGIFERELSSDDVIHFHVHPDALIDLSHIEFAKQKGAKAIVTCHEYSRIGDPVKKELTKNIILSADKVVFTNEADMFQAKFEIRSLKNARLIPVIGGMWLDRDHFNIRLNRVGSLLREPVILYTGMIEPLKGVDKVVETATALPHIQFHIMGKIHPAYAGYAYDLEKRRPSNLRWDAYHQGVKGETMLKAHLDATFSIQLFPGGVLPNSSSIFLAQATGNIVFTTKNGTQPPKNLGKTCVFVKSPDEIADWVLHYQRSTTKYIHDIKQARAVVDGQVGTAIQSTIALYGLAIARDGNTRLPRI